LKIFIPIKENSQRVPNKNFRELSGCPLYKHTLLKLKNFEVYVDTDSEHIIREIREDERLRNVNVFRRKRFLEGDKTSVCRLIQEWISDYDIQGVVCQLHVTSPFLKVETLERARKLIDTGYDSIVSANRIQARFWREETYGFCPVNHNPTRLQQTQDLPVYYEENSLFYLFKSENFVRTNMRIGENPFFYTCSFPENIDIDTEDDWEMATLMAVKSI